MLQNHAEGVKPEWKVMANPSGRTDSPVRFREVEIRRAVRAFRRATGVNAVSISINPDGTFTVRADPVPTDRNSQVANKSLAADAEIVL